MDRDKPKQDLLGFLVMALLVIVCIVVIGVVIFCWCQLCLQDDDLGMASNQNISRRDSPEPTYQFRERSSLSRMPSDNDDIFADPAELRLQIQALEEERRLRLGNDPSAHRQKNELPFEPKQDEQSGAETSAIYGNIQKSPAQKPSQNHSSTKASHGINAKISEERYPHHRSHSIARPLNLKTVSSSSLPDLKVNQSASAKALPQLNGANVPTRPLPPPPLPHAGPSRLVFYRNFNVGVEDIIVEEDSSNSESEADPTYQNVQALSCDALHETDRRTPDITDCAGRSRLSSAALTRANSATISLPGGILKSAGREQDSQTQIAQEEGIGNTGLHSFPKGKKKAHFSDDTPSSCAAPRRTLNDAGVDSKNADESQNPPPFCSAGASPNVPIIILGTPQPNSHYSSITSLPSSPAIPANSPIPHPLTLGPAQNVTHPTFPIIAITGFIIRQVNQSAPRPDIVEDTPKERGGTVPSVQPMSSAETGEKEVKKGCPSDSAKDVVERDADGYMIV